jgi:hypothetical protein
MKRLNEGHGRNSLDDRVVVSEQIFDVIKQIPGGAVQRKIAEIGEPRTKRYWMGMRNTGDPRYPLPTKAERRHFWRAKPEPEDAFMRFRETEEVVAETV